MFTVLSVSFETENVSITLHDVGVQTPKKYGYLLFFFMFTTIDMWKI